MEKSSFDDSSSDDFSVEDSYAEDSSTKNRYKTRIGVQGDQSSARKNSKISHQVVISLVESSDDDDLHDVIEIKDSSDEDIQSRFHCRRSVPISSDSIYAKKRQSNLYSFKILTFLSLWETDVGAEMLVFLNEYRFDCLFLHR